MSPDFPSELLWACSRSFGITIRLLPAPIRHPIALAYLAARLSDTEADGASTPAEVELLARRGDIEALVRASADREAIEGVWATIREGQAFDMARFSPGAPPLDPSELDRYTYLVAGCVGEFWTDICARRLPGFATREAAVLRPLGRRFGQGLQLVNILRDRHEDAERGRVYLAPGRFGEVLSAARDHLEAAAQYCRALRRGRLRAACNLPRLLAIDTLNLVERDPGARRLKVSKSRLWLCLARAWIE